MKLIVTSTVLAEHTEKANVSLSTKTNILLGHEQRRQREGDSDPASAGCPSVTGGSDTRMFLALQELRSSLSGAHLN